MAHEGGCEVTTRDEEPASERGHAEPAALQRLRARVLGLSLSVTATGAPLVAAFMLGRAVLEQRVNVVMVVLCAYTLSFPLLRLTLRRLSFSMGAGLFLGLLLFMAFAVQTRGGPTVGSASLQTLAIVLSGLLFGRAGIALTLLGSVACVAVACFLVIGGHVPPIVEAVWNPKSVAVWVRGGIVLTAFAGATAWAVRYMVDHLEDEALRLQAALVREREQQRALRQAQAEKEEARQLIAQAQRVESMGRLASGVAHDFNNLLTVILGAAEGGRLSAGLPQEAERAFEDITEAALRGADLTRGLLLSGRVDVARPSHVEVAPLIARLLRSVRRLLPDDVELSFEHDAGLALVVDAGQLERVLLNLVLNARDAIDGPGHVSIACRRQLDVPSELGLARAPHVVIEVRDDGDGMDEATRARAFEPFFTTKAVGRGTGLGLAQARAFAEEAGGAVALASAKGEGTSVSLYVPEALGAAPVHEQERAVDDFAVRAERRTALVVEDDPAVLRTTAAVLARAGFHVVEAQDGDEALRILGDRGVRLDLLCIDGVIPGASASAVIASARRQRPDAPIIVCSGYVDEDLLRRGIQAGELACVRKPFTSEELLACIQREMRRTGEAPARSRST